MPHELTDPWIETIRGAAKRLRGSARSAFEAEMAVKFCHGSARKAETIFGWSRETVQRGLSMRATGVERPRRYSARGRRKTEDKLPELVEAINALVEPRSQADPRLRTSLAYTRVTAQSVRNALVDAGTLAGSDFIVDCLQLWWEDRRGVYSSIRKLVIEPQGEMPP